MTAPGEEVPWRLKDAPYDVDVVTRAFSYTGKHIAQRLLESGKAVKALSRRRSATAEGRIAVAPLDFTDRDGLLSTLRGAATLYNTYWVRFPHGRVTFEQAVGNTDRLIEAAVAAGVRRIVHISVTNASEESPLPYFRGKGLVEAAIMRSGLPYAIIRPTLIFGPEDILLNNIAWFLRRLPVFGIPGTGSFRVQPVSVEDVADLAVSAGSRTDNSVQDAVGPEIYTFRTLVRAIADAVGSRARLMHISPTGALLAVKFLGRLVRDVVLTPDELRGLTANLLVSNGPPTGQRRFSEWLAEYAGQLEKRYANELERNYR